MSDSLIEVLSSGGHACVLLETTDDTTIVVRISPTTDESETQAKMQHMLWKHFSPFVLDVRSYTTVSSIPDKYLDVLITDDECDELINKWRLKGVYEYSITKSEYARVGSLAEYQFRQDANIIRTACFHVLCFLYLSEVKFGFTHNDLTAYNIVLGVIERNIVAQVIDFDYSAFHSQATLSVTRKDIGTRYILPPEVLENPNKPSYIGAADVWALGVSMLGCLLNNPDFLDDKPDEKIRARIECLQFYLQKAKVPDALQDTHAEMQIYEAKIHAMDEVTLEFYKCILDTDPLQRIMGGNLYELLKFSSYFEPIPHKDDILKQLVKNRLPDRKYVNTLSTSKAQLERAIAAKLVSGKMIACVQCKQREWPLYMCAQYGVVVCGEECQLQHRQRN